jgi:hypothetical protein
MRIMGPGTDLASPCRRTRTGRGAAGQARPPAPRLQMGEASSLLQGLAKLRRKAHFFAPELGRHKHTVACNWPCRQSGSGRHPRRRLGWLSLRHGVRCKIVQPRAVVKQSHP